MLYNAVVFLVAALVSSLFGFGIPTSAATAVAIGKILFFIFVIMAIVCLVVAAMNGKDAPCAEKQP